METSSKTRESWVRFFESDWMKRPSLIEGVVPDGFVTEGDLFSAALLAARQNRGVRSEQSLRVFVKNASVASDLGDYLPEEADGSFEGYAQRLARKHGIEEFGLQIDNVHQRNRTVQDKVIPLFEPMWRHLGIPMSGAYVDAFIGNYRRTPFGVHRDPLHDFMFVLKGERRMRLWSPDAGSACGLHERQLDYEGRVDGSVQIEGGGGSIIYWPPSYWHVGESPGGLSISMNVNFLSKTGSQADWCGIQPLLNVIEHAQSCRSVSPAPPFLPVDSGGGSCEVPVPPGLSEAIETVREFCASPAFGRAVVADWLAQISRHGFLGGNHRKPSSGQLRLTEGGSVRAVPGSQSYWARHEGSIVCARNGYTRALRDCEAGEPVLTRLLEGGRVKVGALLAACSGPAREALEVFLQELVAIGALEYTGEQRTADQATGAARTGG